MCSVLSAAAVGGYWASFNYWPNVTDTAKEQSVVRTQIKPAFSFLIRAVTVQEMTPEEIAEF